MTWPNRKRVGLIEIGSYAVRRMVATFEPNGNFSLDGSESREYVHGIDIENIEEPKVAALWSAVQQFYRSLVDSAFPLADIWVYGTELCRRLSKGPYRLPSYVMVLSHCCPVDGGYYFIITLQDKGF
jgi:hypothetical protein